jgi:hypothetical protein
MKTYVFVITFLISLAFDACELVVGYISSSDVRGWWPLLAGIAFLSSAVYSLLFSLVAGDFTGWRFVLAFNFTYRAIHFLFFYMFYALPPQDIAAGFFYRLAKNPMTVFAVTVMALLIHFFLVRFSSKRQKTQ